MYNQYIILVFEGLVNKGILEPVQMSEGVAPIVPVLKAEKGTISIFFFVFFLSSRISI